MIHSHHQKQTDSRREQHYICWILAVLKTRAKSNWLVKGKYIIIIILYFDDHCFHAMIKKARWLCRTHLCFFATVSICAVQPWLLLTEERIRSVLFLVSEESHVVISSRKNDPREEDDDDDVAAREELHRFPVRIRTVVRIRTSRHLSATDTLIIVLLYGKSMLCLSDIDARAYFIQFT